MSDAAAAALGRIRIAPKLRIFFSIDIVGSTDFKQSKNFEAQKADSWVTPFLSFYQTSVEQMGVQWERIIAEMKNIEPANGSGRFHFGASPEFWKGAGDEVLFTKVVVSPFDAAAAVHSVLAVMEQHRRQFSDKAQTKGLSVKGSAWLAGFPVNNAEIALAGKASAGVQRALDDLVAENHRLLSLLDQKPEERPAYSADYIGPSIDLGFRLREHATPRRMIVSADLAWLLCHAHEVCNSKELKDCRYLGLPSVGYAGRLELKGILGGERYPLIWIEAEPGNEFDAAEDRLLGNQHLAERAGYVADLAKFCSAFLTGDGPLRMRPYIANWIDVEIGTVPTGHAELLLQIEEHVNGAAAQLASLPQNDDASNSLPDRLTEFAKDLTGKS